MAAPTPATRTAAPAPKPASPTPGRAAAVRPGGHAAEGEVAPGVLELKGMDDFKPPAPVADFLDERKESTVNVRFGNLGRGPLKVQTADKGKYRIRRQPVPLAHPLFSRVATVLPGLAPSLILGVEGAKLAGHVGLAAEARIEELDSHLRRAPELLGLVGFSISSLPKFTNTIEGGSLHLALPKVPIRLGSAFSGSFTLETRDEAVTFSGDATVNVKGLAEGTLNLQRGPDGVITGKASVGLKLPKNISGNVDVAWDGQVITGEGKVGYSGEKLSGSVTLRLMEKSQAEQLEAAAKAPEGATPQAVAASAKARSTPIQYVVFGEGNLNFSFTDWLNGNAQVIISPLGYLTIIGQITPQKEFTLFEQKDYIKPLFKLEVRASYGLPVVGNIFIFGNVGMDLFAKLGPGKFYNIVVDGTYSTDPKKANNFTIRGSLNISAAAGARLRAEAGVGLEILSHDIKAGAGLNGIAGIKAYAEATPIIGYREKVADGQDKKGEFFIRGELEIAAQAFLGLSGDLFVAIETPWWSPISDHKWTWPLFNKEWPIGGSLGLGASVDYVFGSGQLPKLDFKPVDFSGDKFLTDLYDDKAKSGPGKEVEQKGKWQEKNNAAAAVPPKVSPKGNAGPGKLPSAPPAKSKTPAGKKSGKPADPNAKTASGKTVKQLQDEAEKKGKKPPGEAGVPKPAEVAKVIVDAVGSAPFAESGESHRLFGDVAGNQPSLAVESRRLNVDAFLKALGERAELLDDKDKKAAQQAVNQARNQATKLKAEFQRTMSLRGTELKQHVDRIRALGTPAAKALGDALKSTSTGIKTGDSSGQAIPIKWFKPWSAYPPTITLPKNQGRTQFSREGDAPLDNGKSIGVAATNRPTTGKKLQRKKNDVRAAEASFHGMLETRGFKWKEMNADHVHDLGFNGKDDFSNLWPLDNTTNSNANQVYRQKVPYREGQDVKVGTVFALDGKWFEIKKGGV